MAEKPKPPKTMLWLLTSRPMDFLNYVHMVIANILGMGDEYKAPPPGTLRIVCLYDGVWSYVKDQTVKGYKHCGPDWRMDLFAMALPAFAKTYDVYVLKDHIEERGLKHPDDFYPGVKTCTFDDIVKWATEQDYVWAF